VFDAKQAQQPKQHHQQGQDPIDWIFDRTYALFRRKAMARRQRQQTLARQLSRQVRQSLQANQQLQFDTVADAAQAHLATNNSRQTYQYLRNWYKTRRLKPPNPTPTDMDNLHTKYTNL
jgi:hypothetical protein